MITRVLNAELIWVLLLAPSILAPDYFWDEWAYPWAIAALFLFWPLRLLFERRLAPASPLHWPLLSLFGWALLSLGFFGVSAQAITAIAFLCLGVALYFAFVNFSYFQANPLWAVSGLLLVGTLMAAIGPAILLAFPSKMFVVYEELKNTKPISLFGTNETINPNILAGSILLPIPIAIALCLRWNWNKRFWLPPLFGLVGLFMIMTLVLTQSRGSYVALAVALVTLLSIRWRWTLLVVSIMIVAVFAAVGWDGFVLFTSAIGSDGAVNSLSGRWEIWVGSYYALLNYPLFGIGFGSFRAIMPALFPDLAIFKSSGVTHAHNLLLQVGLDLGVPGLLLYLWMWGTAVVLQLRLLGSHDKDDEEEEYASMSRRQRHWLRQRKRNSWLRTILAGGLLTATLAMFIHGIFDAATWGTKPAFLSFLLLAITALLYLHDTEINITEPNDPLNDK